MKKTLNIIALAVFNFMFVVFGLAIAFSLLCGNGEVMNTLNSVFGGYTTETVHTGKEPVYFTSWYRSVDDLIAGNAEYAGAAEAEGSVLLKNETDKTARASLPLDKATDKISLFGVTAYDPIYSLGGAGRVGINPAEAQYFASELEAEGFTINKELASWYNANLGSYRRGDIGPKYIKIGGESWTDVPDTKNASGYNTAIFVVGRMTNEAYDLAPVTASDAELTDGDYLKLTAKEKSMLQGLKQAKDAGTFGRIIVLINAANPLQDDFIDNADYSIDAALWIGFPGSHGISAVADILSGATTPSGRLSAAWYAGRKSNPSWNYFGDFRDDENRSYVIFQEGVYVGYKYAETRYEDSVMGSPDAGDYVYSENVNYPFGYGLSYTSFSREIVSVEKDTDPAKNYDHKGELKSADKQRADGDDYTVKVKVTNTGSNAGKEAVQLYLQQPYTDGNRANGVEKPSVELVGFAKTSKLETGESETVEIKVDANKYFAAYDITRNKYVLEGGKSYLLTVAADAHDAVNNILAYKGYNNDKMTDRNGKKAVGDAGMVKAVQVSAERADTYNYWTQGGAEVTNLFDHADPNKCDPSAARITFMSRNNWKGTVSDTAQKIVPTPKREEGRLYDGGGNFGDSKKNYPYYKDEYPTYGKKFEKPIMLSDLIGVEFDPARGATEEDVQKWDNFLNQLTYEEMCTLTGSGRRRTMPVDSITKPMTNDLNASNGINWKFDPRLETEGGNNNASMGFAARYDKLARDRFPVGYPCEGIVAATFNVDVAYAIGQAIGEDALWAGANGLYGFGLNLQRNPYHGRTGEYYSDDSYLTGVMAGMSSKGAQEKGLYVYNKHFVLNDQETNRSSYATWITEQALRTAYIRPFEIAIEMGDAMCVMTAFSRIGTYWSGNDYNLMTHCLRGELGMRGFAVTDWYPSVGMNMTNGLLAGQDLPDGDAINSLKGKGPGTNNGHLAQAMRVSARRILYTVANSNAMNFYGEGTYQLTHNPEWWGLRDGMLIAIYVLFGMSAAFLAAVYALKIKTYIQTRKNVGK